MKYFNETSITDLREKFELFTNDIAAILRDVELIEQEKINLEKDRAQLNEIKQDVQIREAKISRDNSTYEVKMAEIKSKEEDIRTQLIRLEEKRRETLLAIQLLKKESEDIDFKRAELKKDEARKEELDIKEKDLEYRETMIIREKTIDKERKLMLDAKEARIMSEQDRISRILPA